MKKILVIGGAHQGKTQWVEKQFPQYQRVSMEQLLAENQKGVKREGAYIQGFHLYMKGWLQEKEDYKAYTGYLLENPSWLLICDEIGSGIVPLEREDREWREETGRMLCRIAEEADEVYRVFCGIPMQIKGCDRR